MAITPLSSYSTKHAPSDESQALKMASLAGEQLSATNGVNGRSDALSPSPAVLSSAPSKAAEAVDAVDVSTVAESSSKNAASFVANASTSTEPAQSAPADAELSADKPAAEAPAETPAVAPAAASSRGLDAAEATPDAAKHSPVAAAADAASEVVAKDEQPIASAPGSVPTSAPADPAEPAPHSSKPATDMPAPAAPAPEAQPEHESARESDAKAESQEDVDMIDAVSEAPEGNSFDSTKIASEKLSTPGSSAPSSNGHHSSSLLPSLRDEPPRETAFGSAGSDSVMADAQPVKVARAREDDVEQGPSAKRAKTEDAEERVTPAAAAASASAPAASAQPAENGTISVNTTGIQIDMSAFVVPPRVRAMAKEGSLAHPDLDDAPISEYANREIRRVLASVKKTKAGGNFKDPVHKKWPMLWDAYTQRVAKPVDIGMLERNLRDKVYANHGEFNNDVFLIFENSVSFNGLGNTITEEAKVLVDNVFVRLSDVPAREPQKSEKKESKAQPTRHTEPRGAAARRESRGAAVTPIEDSVAAVVAASPTAAGLPAGAVSAGSPGAATAAAAHAADTAVFAVPSSGVPIIRRDSAKNDGDRPKRPIHPPKNRDLGYEPKNTKKKQPEFRFCEEVLKELMKAKHYEINHWFLRPVDPVAMQIPTYHKVIKKPMDLGTMQTKLNLGEYASAKDFENDLLLIVKNCRKFNIEGEVVNASDRLEDLFKEKWAEKDSWVAAHTTVVSPTALKGEDSDSELEDSDDELDDGSGAPLSSDTVDALVKRLEEEYDRLNKLLMARVPDMTVIVTQQVVTNMLQKQIVEEKMKLAAAEASRRNHRAARAKAGKNKKALGAVRKSGGLGAGGKKAATAATATTAAAVSKKPKSRALGLAEKSVVTDGINNLAGVQLEKAIDIIKKDTHQEESEDGELELDIDQLSQDALGKLYDLVVRNFPAMRIKTEKKAPAVDAAGLPVGKPSKPKKHKPMGKLEQERNIEKLREIKAQFQRPGSGSQEPIPSVELSQALEAEESEEESEVDSEEE